MLEYKFLPLLFFSLLPQRLTVLVGDYYVGSWNVSFGTMGYSVFFYAYIFVRTGVIEKVYVLGAARTARSLGCT